MKESKEKTQSITQSTHSIVAGSYWNVKINVHSNVKINKKNNILITEKN